MAHDVGDLIFDQYDTTDRLVCDGSLVTDAEYPELSTVMSGVTLSGVGTPPAGSFYLPTIRPVRHGIPVLIQAK